MLVIDGETLDPSIADQTTKHFDYFIHQSYQATTPSYLDTSGWGYAKKSKFRPDQYVPAVNYENGKLEEETLRIQNMEKYLQS